MKRIILAIVLCLAFITPANALSISTDIVVSCWIDNSESPKDVIAIVLSKATKSATIINPDNIFQKGKLTITEYFYTIKFSGDKPFFKSGEVKINRLTGRFSSEWILPATEERKTVRYDPIYGMCIKNENSGFRVF